MGAVEGEAAVVELRQDPEAGVGVGDEVGGQIVGDGHAFGRDACPR